MEVDEALTFIENLLADKKNKALGRAEKAVFEAAWNNETYKATAEAAEYNAQYLQCHVGPSLWTLLSAVMHQEVTKKRLRSIVEQRIAEEALMDRTSPVIFEGRQPPETGRLFGRDPDFLLLKEYVKLRQFVVVSGQAGIGKSALAARLIDYYFRLNSEFQVVIWQSVYAYSSLANLVNELLRCLGVEVSRSDDLAVRVQKLIEVLTLRRCLLVLDGAEVLLKGNSKTDPYGENSEYRWFFAELVEQSHSSCVILTSREPFIDIQWFQETGKSAQVIKLEG